MEKSEKNNANGDEAARLLGIAEKLLISKDFNGAREFAILAQEIEPLLDGSDQILAVSDVYLASEKRINNHHDWYAILQVDRSCNDLQLIRQQYRRLALLLQPDKNHLLLADLALKLVADAWAVLSNSSKKSFYDAELSLISKTDGAPLESHNQMYQRHTQSSVSQSSYPSSYYKTVNVSNSGGRMTNDSLKNASAGTTKLFNFWTVCPYCSNLYEYARVYKECCLKCQNCGKAFTAAEIKSLPSFVEGKEAYYCNWNFFPVGITFTHSEIGKGGVFTSWMPMMFPPFGMGNGSATEGNVRNECAHEREVEFVDLTEEGVQPAAAPFAKKRCRPEEENVQLH